MSLYNLPNATGGLDDILVQVVTEIPSFMVMTTLFVYMFVFIVGMGLQTKRTGFADAPLWSTLGLISASFLNLIFSLGTGIINPVVLGITIAFTMFSALWLFLDRGRNEK
tara:strand:+ start:182 stop:511 length:330 start_codon:yes stop_codon:yes gene_type:complete